MIETRSADLISFSCPISALTIAWLLVLNTQQLEAADLQVAVASNFSIPMRVIAERFRTLTGHGVKLSIGSSGRQYAQIKHGAPFDAFFSADTKRPKRLDEEGIALPGSRFTYALGKIVLWSPRTDYVDAEGRVLNQGNFSHLAIANPKLAPYGQAAREVLQALGLWNALHGTLVRGENIGQTYQFVRSGNAQLGFVSYSQVKRGDLSIEGSFWEIPQTLYSPIEQQAVLLRDNTAARNLLQFMKSDESLKIIRGFGYGVP